MAAVARIIDQPSSGPPAGAAGGLGNGVGTINQLIRRPDGSLVVTEEQRKGDPALASLSLEITGDGTIAEHSAELPAGLVPCAVAPTVRVPGAEHMAVVQKGAGLDATLRFIVS